MPWFCSLYSGISRYLSNSLCHAASDIGGMAPVTGFHSVIDKPLSVRRVRPPTRIIIATSVNRIISQSRMPLRAPRLPASITPVTGAAISTVSTSSKMLRFLLILCLFFWRLVDQRGRPQSPTLQGCALLSFSLCPSNAPFVAGRRAASAHRHA